MPGLLTSAGLSVGLFTNASLFTDPRKAKPGSAVRDSKETFPLPSLPAPVLAHIAKLGMSRSRYGHPLLGVSQACRDAVLRATRTMSCTPKWTGASAAQKSADARLLHRACCEADPGLAIRLCMQGGPDALSVLLQPGISSGGWTKVLTLEVCHVQESVHRIPLAFPCLSKLSLNSAQLRDGALFDMLACQASCMLRSLTLTNCSINADAARHAAHSLARLPHLQDLTVTGPGVPVSIATQLTGLTSLILSNDADAEQIFMVAGHNTGLAHLKFGMSSARPPVQASHHFALLSNCTSLTHLNIAGLQIDGQAVDILLTHCTNITDLTLGPATLDSSRADRQCSWRKLSLLGPPGDILFQVAYLPLRSVQILEAGLTIVGRLLLPDAVPASQLPSLLHQAATNLASCPAWARAAPSRLSLQGAGQALTAGQRVELLQALAPLCTHVTEMIIYLWHQLELGCMEVQALANSTGGSLQSLSIHNCTLLGTFWKALTLHLPQLAYLELSGSITANVMDIAMYLSMRSSSSSQPLRLEVSQGVLDAQSKLQLEQHITSWQLQGITLLTKDLSDEEDDDDEYDEEEEVDDM